MKISTVGKIKNIKYNTDTNDLEILIKVIDNKFKKKILRDLDLSGHIYFEGNELIYDENVKKND